METSKYPGQVVFGLDIGTRSIVGTVGYLAGDQFMVIAQVLKEHETRAMLDGQIHDIAQVGATISAVKEILEQKTGLTLTDVCIAAAGRVLKTVVVRAQITYEDDHNVTKEDIYGLETLGVENAYKKFGEENHTDIRFYCVGYSVVKYYLNDYPISNLEEHKARKIEIEMIATFLPDDVVDGLYKAVEIADLHVANLTLEPIAAIQVAIPQMYRMLNIALIDVGAGTSDISITRDGSIEAYGMIPIAGDSLTEVIAQHCLVDFTTAEHIKRGAADQEVVSFRDIMGLPQTITREEVMEITKAQVESMAKQVSEKIKELNGDKPVSAIFIVGGGGKLPSYAGAVAQEMGISPERVALRGEEVMQKIHFLQPEKKKDSLLVTPIGICLAFYEQSNNFIYVTFNHQRIKLYDNSRLAVVDAALQANYPNTSLFPKRGEELRFMLNGKEKIIRGQLGEAAGISVNDVSCDITTRIHANDIISVKESTNGEAAACTVEQLPGLHEKMTCIVNGQTVSLPKYAVVNGQLQTDGYQIHQNDQVEVRNYYTLGELLEFMDIPERRSLTVCVNHEPADPMTRVYENFSVEYEVSEEIKFEADTVTEQEKSLNKAPEHETSVNEAASDNTIVVIANGSPVRMKGKTEYIYVDIFDYIDFDLSEPHGMSVVTLLNGQKAGYVDILKNGDKIDIYWEQ